MSLRTITNNIGDANWSAMEEQAQRVLAQLPTSGWATHLSTLAMNDLPNDSDDLPRVNEALHVARRTSAVSQEARWYGIVPGSGGGGLASGHVSSGFDDNLTGSTAAGYSRNRSVHEIGHTLGLHHSVNAAENGTKNVLWVVPTQKRGWCTEVADMSAPEYPYWYTASGSTKAAIGPVGNADTEVWGADTRLVQNSVPMGIVAPTQVWSLMSYCTPSADESRWIGKTDYASIMTGDRKPISDDDVASVAGSGLDVRGLITATGEAAELLPAQAVNEGPTADDPQGTHLLTVISPAGETLHQVRFTPIASIADAAGTGESEAFGSFIVHVVVPNNLPVGAKVAISKASTALTSGTVSAHKPTVGLAGVDTSDADSVTVKWAADDADGDDVTTSVFYSADDGATWELMGIDLAGSSIRIDRRALPAAQAARFKLVTSDGLGSTTAVSDAFVLPNVGPSVRITSPTSATTIAAAQTVVFSASANDTEDGPLTGPSLQWVSDRDGQLGQGESLTMRADQLSEGTHQITVTATDSDGGKATATTTLTVQRIATPVVTVDVTFDGFEPPVASQGVTKATAGRTVPVKFSVSGADAATGVVEAGFLSDGATASVIESGEHWHINVKTPKSWAGTQQTFRVALADGTHHDAVFAFR